MRKLFFPLAVILIAASSCTGVKVVTDMDEAADFTKYKSVSFLGWQDDIDQVVNELEQKRLRESVKAEMKKRDLELVESGGDIVISLFVVVDEKTSTTAYTNYYGTRSYRRGGWGWGSGYATTTYTESDYLQGTLVVDAFDESSKDLIWQSVGVGTMKTKPEKRAENLPNVIAKIFKDFPVAPAE